MRPYLQEFLRNLCPFFELIVLTTLDKNLFTPILSMIEQNNEIFDFIVPKNHCYYVEDRNLYIKDLKIMYSERTANEVIMCTSKPEDFIF